MGQAILVIDDDADFTELLEEVLTAKGHRVGVVQDPANVAEKLTSFRPEVVLLDLSLGGADGLKLGPELRSAGVPPFYLVAVTGWTDSHTKQAVKEAGFDGFLPKPLDLVALDEVLEVNAAVLEAS